MIRFMKGTYTHRNKDWWFLCEGPEGSGKSTTKDQIIKRIDPRLHRDDAIFSIRHLMDVMEDCRKNQVYNIDEGVNIFHNQDWATWEAKALTKLIRQMRIMKSLWAIAAPDYHGMHHYLRDYRLRQRFYHRPVFDADGMGNGPPAPFWKDERFDYKTGDVTHRWTDLEFDLHVEPMDDDPDHAAYEAKKEQNFRELVQQMRTRFGHEEAKEERARAKAARPKQKPKPQNPPPTTT